ncbi:glycosyltransferase [Geopseudomonas aromaticivorans]
MKDRLKRDRLSLLIPAHQAMATLPPLVCKLLAQAGDAYPVEIVISVDDGQDYRAILPADERIRYAEEGFKSGPAVARNRALAEATGSHVCPIDADDDVSDLFLARPGHLLAGVDTAGLVGGRLTFFA